MLVALFTVLGFSAPMCVTADALNVRSGPGTGYSVRRSVYKGQAVDVISNSNGWSKLGDGTYVSSQWVSSCPTRKMCTTAALNVRRAPSTGSVIKVLPDGGAVTVYGSAVNGWNLIGTGQYVSSAYLGNCGGGGGGGGGNKADTVIAYAHSRLGDPYSMPLAGTGRYLDCSKLAQLCYAQIGLNIPRTAADQCKWATDSGRLVSYSQATRGSLIFWSFEYNGRYRNVGHVGIYLGNGQVIDASYYDGKVVKRGMFSLGNVVGCAKL